MANGSSLSIIIGPTKSPTRGGGVVRVHAKDRREFDRLAAIDPPIDSACVFVGDPLPSNSFQSYSSIVVRP
jgi:hypothetical protein